MSVTIQTGDALDVLRTLPSESVHACVTSPPYYGLRDYGVPGQVGLEPSPGEYVERLVDVFREVRRVLRDDGTLWLNIGDTYASDTKGSGGTGKSTLAGTPANGNGQNFASRKINHGAKAKDLLGIPWMVALALRADGWYLRSDIIWAKPNPMPESVTDRPTKSHEHVFLFSKSPRYFYDADAIAEPAIYAGTTGCVSGPKQASRAAARCAKPSGNEITGAPRVAVADTRNARDVWTIATQPFSGAHFACMPQALAERCILAGCPGGGTVLDPFAGAGTTGLVARKRRRIFVGIELNPAYADMARKRISDAFPLYDLFEEPVS